MTTNTKSTRTKSVPKKSASPHAESPAALHELRMPADGHRFDLRYVRVPWRDAAKSGKHSARKLLARATHRITWEIQNVRIH